MKTTWFPSSVLIIACLQQGCCQFIAEPGPVYGLLYQPLYIPCVTSTHPNYVNWRRSDGQLIGHSVYGIGHAFRNDYALTTCNQSCQNFTIKITSVSLDEPQLFCEAVYAGETKPEQSDKSAITVIAPPYGDPTCSMESSTVNLGDDVKLTCNSKGGIPAAKLKWKTEGSSTVLHPGPGTLGPTDSNRRKSRNLTHSFTAKKEHNGQTYTCTSENTATALLFERGELPAAHMSCSTGPLTVHHPPEQTKIGPADPYIVIEGESAVITCKASEGSPDVYEYKYRQHEESWSKWISTDEKTYARIEKSQAGEYKCQARNTAGEDGEKAINVQIHYPPENIKISASGHEIGDDYPIKEGENLVLDCEATASNPTATYEWTNTGNTVQNTAQLVINNIQQTASGIYTCTATNMMTPTDTANKPGTGTKSVEVTVQYKPGPATTPRKSLNVTKENSVTLECQVDVKGVPPATFTWMKGSKPLTTSDSTGQYTINSAEVKDDDGQYQCIPTNKIGSGPAANISVVVQTIPTVETRPQDTMVVNTDSDLEMKCSFEARPAATIKWKYSNGTDLRVGIFDFKKVETTSGHAEKYTTTKSTLTWKLQSDPLDRRHFGGQIKCTADNGVGSAVASNTVELDVQYAPDIQLTDPIDLKKGVTKGEVVSLYVEAIANPRPANMYKWQIVKSGSSEDIPKAGYVVENIDQGSKLTIENITIEQFANYSLVATNDHGSSSVAFEVTGSDKPNKPTDFNLTATAVSLFAEWNRGWNGGLDQVFILEYLETQDEIEDLVKKTYHSVKLDQDDGVAESRKYTVTLYAKNSKGQSDSISKTISTKAKPTVNSKETVINHDKQAREATITWSISAQSFTLIVVKVCGVKEDCLSHNITDTTQPTTVTVPDGDELSFSFNFYDGSELVSEQSNFIKIVPAKSKTDFALIIGAVFGAIVVLALIIGILAFLIWRKRSGKDNDDKTSGKRLSLLPKKKKKDTAQDTGCENGAMTEMADIDPYAVAGAHGHNGLSDTATGDGAYAEVEPKKKGKKDKLPDPMPLYSTPNKGPKSKSKPPQAANNDMPEYASVDMQAKAKNRQQKEEEAAAPVYAEVKKDKKGKKKQDKQEKQEDATVYAQVDKGKKGKKNKKGKTSDPENEFTYENVGAPQRKRPQYINSPPPPSQDGAYADVRSPNARVPYDDNPYQDVDTPLRAGGVQIENPYGNDEPEKTVGPDGTIYSHVEFKNRTTPAAEAQVLGEDNVEYAAIDFNRQGPVVSDEQLAEYERQQIVEMERERVLRERALTEEKRKLDAGIEVP